MRHSPYLNRPLRPVSECIHLASPFPSPGAAVPPADVANQGVSDFSQDAPPRSDAAIACTGAERRDGESARPTPHAAALAQAALIDEDRRRFLRGLRNALWLVVPLWALLLWWGLS